MNSLLLVILVCISVCAYVIASKRAQQLASANGGLRYLHSRPSYYGMLAAIVTALPALLILFVWSISSASIIQSLVMAGVPDSVLSDGTNHSLIYSQIQHVASGIKVTDHAWLINASAHYQHLLALGDNIKFAALIALAVAGLIFGWKLVGPKLRARPHVESVMRGFLLICSILAILTTFGIVLSVLFEAIRFFNIIPLTDFLFGLQWSPQVALRADQQGASGAFGFIPLLTGTLMISFIAMSIAAPIGLMSAIYLAEYASPRVRSICKPLLEVLAGIPTVVYGFFAALVVAPLIRDSATAIGIESVSSESALAAGLIMGVMIIPFVSSLSDDVITAVPQSLRDGALSLGATRSETIKSVVLPAALPGVVGGLLLAVSRAIGETMIVVMAAGLSANLTANPFESVTTITVQIVTLLIGDQEFDSPKTLAAFALGLSLFVVTLALNFVALRIVKKYREQYD
ncbi:phosphate ABC transporter permease subunit PstC [Ferrimonas lipolytica]|uniref:Phosphate transport system permease protein n=1 Tax=Ferrimonas lipolytica TaxID=2724191 RepID=A0A6H1UE42_9GAMM|nr:phosphate ABC transporter permease subunit PstC [Ferrimonas lipolytica]QIZ76486.1 phosphate ABC transporter permease subunit PstC [Ferrimonas lipolytica]